MNERRGKHRLRAQVDPLNLQILASRIRAQRGHASVRRGACASFADVRIGGARTYCARLPMRGTRLALRAPQRNRERASRPMRGKVSERPWGCPQEVPRRALARRADPRRSCHTDANADADAHSWLALRTENAVRCLVWKMDGCSRQCAIGADAMLSLTLVLRLMLQCPMLVLTPMLIPLLMRPTRNQGFCGAGSRAPVYS